MSEHRGISETDAPEIWQGFRRLFGHSGCELPSTLPAEGTFDCGPWTFRYAVNDDGGLCLDLVAASAHAGQQVHRVRASGDLESGPDLQTVLVLDPGDDDMDAARERQRAHNERVADTLRARRLL